jgi:hypothetical protein
VDSPVRKSVDWMQASAAIEAATGLILIFRPSLLIRLLLAMEASSTGEIIGRFAGFALIALALASWPVSGRAADRRQRLALFGYNTLAGLYFVFVGFSGVAGVLLWPAAAIHLAFAVLLSRAWLGAAGR